MIAAGAVAASLFIMLCMMFYGPEDYLSPEKIMARGDGLRFQIASVLVEPFGAGAFLGVGLVLVWGIIAYFTESLGALLPKFVGFGALVPSFCAMTSMGGEPTEFWAGSVGVWAGDVMMQGFGPLLGWVVMGSLFIVSFALATQFGFYNQLSGLRGSLSFPLLPSDEDEGGTATAVLPPPTENENASGEDLTWMEENSPSGPVEVADLSDVEVPDTFPDEAAVETEQEEDADTAVENEVDAEMGDAIDALFGEAETFDGAQDEAAVATEDDEVAVAPASDVSVMDLLDASDVAFLEEAVEAPAEEAVAPVADAPLSKEERLADIRARLHAGEDVSEEEIDLLDSASASSHTRCEVEAEPELVEAVEAVLDAPVVEEVAAEPEVDEVVADMPFDLSFLDDSPAAVEPVVEEEPAETDLEHALESFTEAPADAPVIEEEASGADSEVDESHELPPFLMDPNAAHPLLDQQVIDETPPPPATVEETPDHHARVISEEEIKAAVTETEEMPVASVPDVLPAPTETPKNDPFSYAGVEFLPPNEELADLQVEDAPSPELPLEVESADEVDETPAEEPEAEQGHFLTDEGGTIVEDEILTFEPFDDGTEEAVEEPSVDDDAPVDEADGEAAQGEDPLAELFGEPVSEPYDAAVTGAPEEPAASLAPSGPAQMEPREPPVSEKADEEVVAKHDTSELPEPEPRTGVISDCIDDHGIQVDPPAAMDDEPVLVDEEVIVPQVVVDDLPAPVVEEPFDGAQDEDAATVSAEQAADAIVDSLVDLFGEPLVEETTPEPVEEEPTPEPELDEAIVDEVFETPLFDDVEVEAEAPAPVEDTVVEVEEPVVDGAPAEENFVDEVVEPAVDEVEEEEDVTPAIDDERVDALADLFRDEDDDTAAPVEVTDEDVSSEGQMLGAPDLVEDSPREDRDPLYDEAVEAVRDRGRGSVIVLQRKLDVGFTRATRILAQLVEDGILGPETASGSHPLL
jgi:hypothetical protein